MGVNALYGHSSVFVSVQPEKQDLTSYFVAFQQIGSILFLGFHRFVSACNLLPASRTSGFITLMLMLSTAAMLITSTSYYETTYLVGSQKSIVLYVAMTVAGFTSASSNVFFYPVMAQYPRRYIAAYTFGLSLSSTSTGVAALIQDGPNSLYISPSAYFAFFTIVAALSTLSYVFLASSQTAARVRLDFVHEQADANTDPVAEAEAVAAAALAARSSSGNINGDGVTVVASLEAETEADLEEAAEPALPAATAAERAAVAGEVDASTTATITAFGATSAADVIATKVDMDAAAAASATAAAAARRSQIRAHPGPALRLGARATAAAPTRAPAPPLPAPEEADIPFSEWRLVKHYARPLGCITWIAALSFGIIPSFLPYAALSYHNGSRVYLIGSSVTFFVDPLSRLLINTTPGLRVAARRVTIPLLSFSLTTVVALIVALAVESPYPWGWRHSSGGALSVVLSALAGAIYSFTSTAVFFSFHDVSAALDAARTDADPQPSPVQSLLRNAVGAGAHAMPELELPASADADVESAGGLVASPSPVGSSLSRAGSTLGRVGSSFSRSLSKVQALSLAKAEGIVRGKAFQFTGLGIQIGATTGAIVSFLVVVVFSLIPDPMFR
jgi:hypothetical protein